MPKHLSASLRAVVFGGAVVFLAACDGLLGDPIRSPLDGLAYAVNEDSAGNPPPDPPTGEVTPGYVLGTVVGPWNGAGSSNDTLANSPRIAGVTVAAYRLPASGTVTDRKSTRLN